MTSLYYLIQFKLYFLLPVCKNILTDEADTQKTQVYKQQQYLMDQVDIDRPIKKETETNVCK